MDHNPSQDMDDDEINLNFGQNYINVYLPNDDSSSQAQRNAPPPSPVFMVEDGVFKFSDEVLKDRHMFIGKKAFYPPRQYTGDETRKFKSVRKETATGQVEEEKDEEHQTVNIVKLSFDSKASGMKVTTKPRSRFNERLSAYVTSRKKIQSANNNVREQPASPRTPRTPRSNTSMRSVMSRNADSDTESVKNFQRLAPPMDTPAPSRIGRRSLSFRIPDSPTIPNENKFPPMQRMRSFNSEREELRRDRTLWFPDAATNHSSSRSSRYGKMPTRPSSNAHKIWRQSSDILVSRKTPSIEDVMPDKLFLRQPVLVRY